MAVHNNVLLQETCHENNGHKDVVLQESIGSSCGEWPQEPSAADSRAGRIAGSCSAGLVQTLEGA